MDHNIFNHIGLYFKDEAFEPHPALNPVSFLPGSSEKIDAMTYRISMGEEAFHPGDLTSFVGARDVKPEIYLRKN